MAIFKKIFKKSKKKKEQESWFNNTNGEVKRKWVPADEGGMMGSPNSVYYTTSQSYKKPQ